MQLPPFVAHRFGRAYGPDSSRAALERALGGELGGVETDCCLTRDGEVVLLHDAFLPHSVGEPGWAHERSARELSQMRLRSSAGGSSDERPLLLTELLAERRLRGRITQLEVKAFASRELANETARAVCETVRRAGIPEADVELISFWPDACALAAGQGFAARAIVACAYAPDALARWAAGCGVSGVILEAHYFAWPVVERLRREGLSVMSGVVNDAPLALVVLEFEPDAVATDRPHELREELLAL